MGYRTALVYISNSKQKEKSLSYLNISFPVSKSITDLHTCTKGAESVNAHLIFVTRMNRRTSTQAPNTSLLLPNLRRQLFYNIIRVLVRQRNVLRMTPSCEDLILVVLELNRCKGHCLTDYIAQCISITAIRDGREARVWREDTGLTFIAADFCFYKIAYLAAGGEIGYVEIGGYAGCVKTARGYG
jgi:hypothetical protein